LTPEVSGSPLRGGLCLPISKHTGILTQFQTKVNKKTAKKHLFLAALFPIEIRTLSPIISLKCAEFVALMGMWIGEA